MKNKKTNNTEDKAKKNNLVCVIKGILISILSSLLLLFFMSIILAYSNTSEAVIPVAIIVISSISILMGSAFSTKSIMKNGLINGAIVGCVYILILYLLSSIIMVGFNLNMKSLIMMLVSIVIGMTGGIIGVNIRKN
ncbi:MAG: TIGR04086 family membrane protein [Clostridia bacterium]|nr:TIGR04086 family membrane protein [Clostridia bacterium]